MQITIKEVHLCRNEEVDRETTGQPAVDKAVETVPNNKTNKYGK